MVEVDLDGVRFRDIGGFGILGLGVAGLGILFTASEVVSILTGEGASLLGALAVGGFVVFFGLFFVHEDISPEFDGFCEHCGKQIVANSGADDVTEHVVVHTSAEPRRLTVGGRSIVTERRRTDHHYCSPACAGDDTRYVVSPHGWETDDPAAYEVVD